MQRLEEWFDYILLALLAGFLGLHYSGGLNSFDDRALFVLAFIGTIPVVISAFRSLKNREISIDLLASIALVASMLAKEWPSAVFINLMLSSARIFGRYTEGQARRAIQSLLKLRPQQVKVRRAGAVTEISVEDVKVGDLVVIEAGERVAVDGIVEDGTASIDQSSLTGESIPVSKQKGDRVFSSTLNVSGTLEVRADKIGSDTTLAKIIRLVESSQESKAGIHTIAESFTTWYISSTLIGAVIVYFWTGNLNFVLALLLVACADDIAVAVPLAFLAAIGTAARQGIIIKGGDFLEGLTKVKTLLMDKTGTLTAGILRVQAVVPFDNFSSDDLIKYAATAECLSDHPAAKAIVLYAKEKHIDHPQPNNCHETPGKGSVGELDGKEIISGKLTFMQDKKIPVSNHQLGDLESAKNKGLNTTLIAYGGELIGFIGLADQIRPEVPEAIKELKSLGVSKLVMLTGDNEKVAQKIADEVGITDIHANLLPEDKLTYIKKELNKKTKVAMVGDGVNDAAALALADVGIAMGVIGSDAAIEAADIALMKDDFSKIGDAIELGRYTMSVARQDFWIWGIVNAIGFGLVIAGVIGPAGAAAYNFATDFIPFANSSRLFYLHKRLGL